MSYVKSSQFNLFQVIYFFSFFSYKNSDYLEEVCSFACVDIKVKKLTPCNGRSSDSPIIIASFFMFYVVCG